MLKTKRLLTSTYVVWANQLPNSATLNKTSIKTVPANFMPHANITESEEGPTTAHKSLTHIGILKQGCWV